GLLFSKARLDPAVEPLDHSIDKGLVGLQRSKVPAAAQLEGLTDAAFEGAVGALDGAVLVGLAEVVGGGAEAVVATEPLVLIRPAVDLVVARRAEAVGAVLLGDAAGMAQGTLQASGEGCVALA